jgi:hypothetical protein
MRLVCLVVNVLGFAGGSLSPIQVHSHRHIHVVQRDDSRDSQDLRKEKEVLVNHQARIQNAVDETKRLRGDLDRATQSLNELKAQVSNEIRQIKDKQNEAIARAEQLMKETTVSGLSSQTDQKRQEDRREEAATNFEERNSHDPRQTDNNAHSDPSQERNKLIEEIGDLKQRLSSRLEGAGLEEGARKIIVSAIGILDKLMTSSDPVPKLHEEFSALLSNLGLGQESGENSDMSA